MNKLLKFFALAGVVISSAACQLTKDSVTPDKPSADGDLVLSADKYIITADGVDGAVITVKIGDEEILEGVTFYSTDNKKMDIPNMYFQAETPAQYSFWASYKTKVSKPITITAISARVPELPEDSAPQSYDFTRKLLLTQFTGTGCGWCPFMINLLNDFATINSDKFVWTVCHSFNQSDPAYLSGSLPGAMSIKGYPYVALDLNPATGFNDYTNASAFKRVFDKEYDAEKAKAGISVSNVLDGNLLIVKTGIKPSEDGEYHLGVWVLEDGINSKQTNNGATGSFDVHNNCIRLISGQNGNKDFSGIKYTLKKGEVSEQIVIFELPSKVKGENCHVVAFVSTERGGTFYVNNAIDCPLDGEVAFSYNN